MDQQEHGSSRPTSNGYEFKPAEEIVIGESASWVGYYSWISILLGVLLIALGATNLPAGVGAVGLGLVYLIIGAFFRGAAASMLSVVSTAGHDVPHLMTALDRLTLAFKVQVVLFLAALIGGVVGIMALSGVGL